MVKTQEVECDVKMCVCVCLGGFLFPLLRRNSNGADCSLESLEVLWDLLLAFLKNFSFLGLISDAFRALSTSSQSSEVRFVKKKNIHMTVSHHFPAHPRVSWRVLD